MSDMIILEEEKTEKTISIEVISGKREVHVSYNKGLGCVNVLCRNASHNAFRGAGRTFWGHMEAFTNAKNAYKSSDVKAAIEYASSLV